MNGSGPRPAAHCAKRCFLNCLETSFKPSICLLPTLPASNLLASSCSCLSSCTAPVKGPSRRAKTCLPALPAANLLASSCSWLSSCTATVKGKGPLASCLLVRLVFCLLAFLLPVVFCLLAFFLPFGFPFAIFSLLFLPLATCLLVRLVFCLLACCFPPACCLLPSCFLRACYLSLTLATGLLALAACCFPCAPLSLLSLTSCFLPACAFCYLLSFPYSCCFPLPVPFATCYLSLTLAVFPLLLLLLSCTLLFLYFPLLLQLASLRLQLAACPVFPSSLTRSPCYRQGSADIAIGIVLKTLKIVETYWRNCKVSQSDVQCITWWLLYLGSACDRLPLNLQVVIFGQSKASGVVTQLDLN